jgi:AraC-like DNA-binding protein
MLILIEIIYVSSSLTTNIIPLVKKLVEAVQPLAQSKHVILSFTVSVTECILDHQPENVAGSLLAVLCRIVDHLPSGTSLQVAVSENEVAAVIRIENSGINLSRISTITKGISLPVRIDGDERHRTVYYFDIAKTTNGIIRPRETILVKSRANTNIPAFYAEIRKRLQSYNSSDEKIALLTKVHNPADAAFLQKINELIFANIANESFDVDCLAEKMFLSRSQVFRKLKLITGKAPAAYIKSLRLQQAKKMLETTDVRVSEAAFATGFESVSHFTKVFSSRYGFKPSLLKRKTGATNEQKDAT